MRKKSVSYIKISFILLIVLAFGLFSANKLAFSASPSDGGVYNPYDPYDGDFDYGFDDCNNCDFDDDDDDNDDEPDATTRSATSVGDTTATLNARVDGNGSSTRVWFEYGRDRDLDDETSQKSIGSGTDTVSTRISGLRRDTTYYFRVVARNNDGTDSGSIMSFRTDENDNNDSDDELDSDKPSTRTDAATFVSTNSAQLNSFIKDSGNNTSTWFEWGTNTGLGNQTRNTLVDASPSFTNRTTVVGLTPGTTYYFRAVAENDDWRSNGATLSFTTHGGSAQNPPNNPPTPPVGGTVDENPTPSETPEENVQVDGVKSSLTANVLGFSFFPTTLLGWLAFIILILMLYILGRKYLYPPTHQAVTVDTHGHH